jgi:cytochrome c oxidase subunit 2
MHAGGAGASDIAAVTWFLIAISSLVVVAVALALVWVWLRSRTAPDERETVSGETPVRWLGAYIPAVILAATFGVGLFLLVDTRVHGDGPVQIDVTGRQWFWDVTYPEAGVRTANEIHVPVGRTVTLHLTSADVIHSFWVPSLDRKMDLVPGRTNELDIKAERAGTYEGSCAEFCGKQHTNMRLLVIAEPEAQFEAWQANQSADAVVPTNAEQIEGQQTVMGSCSYCHTIAGTTASGEIGPDLTHIASRRDLGAGTVTNTPGNLAAWILDSQSLKPGNKMPAIQLSGKEVNAVVAYLRSLT